MRVLIKGAGDLASGIACRLHQCGMKLVMTDLPVPTAVRRTVSFSRAVYEEEAVIEGNKAVLCHSLEEIEAAHQRGEIAVWVDPDAEIRKVWKPDVLVDAIIAKKNLNTTIGDAPIVLAVGPGFTAGVDCHCVVETKRGHYLGRCIYEGSAIANTGIPGDIGGYTKERILRASAHGSFRPLVEIGHEVTAGEVCGEVLTADGSRQPMKSQIAGVVRGLLQEGVEVNEGMKAGDVDPRCQVAHCDTVSDKARAIGGGVLEAILHLRRQL